MKSKKTLYIQDDVLNNTEQDTFGHKYIADAIVDSIINTSPPFIIGVFGGWGTGKSSLLKIINKKLNSKSIETVFIDAWKYTSAKNLQRAFLINVANSKNPELLGELRRKLYASEQETLPVDKKRLEKNKKLSCSQILNLFKYFLLTSITLILFLLIFFFFEHLITTESDSIRNLNNFFVDYDWKRFFDKYFDLLFIPFFLTFVNYLQVNIFQRSITVSHERIDADELFTDYFNEVIDRVVKNKCGSKKRLVIFIDNLDRLTDKKMVEALESLKTYISNDKCVFIVACDDSVVRAVINKSKDIPGNKESIPNSQIAEYKAGEHYLDKFFQQTFRLPEYMNLDLHDFAVKNFSTTQLCERIKSDNIDIKNLVSIILPTDVESPRKVKRLLNDFIAMYYIVEKREKQGQLRPGIITENPEFLGKFSTIRTEFPYFYKLMVDDNQILAEVTNLIITDDGDGIKNKMDLINKTTNVKSLISYLRKTQSIMVEDIGPYIWMSQDNLSLGLPREQIRSMQNSLSNGDIELFKNQYATINEDDKKKKFIQIASRITNYRLVGIEQQNGVKVLSHLLPTFSEDLKPEIAHVIANLISLWSKLDMFSSMEILNVLKWSHREFYSQKQNLIDELINRLDDNERRKSTFTAIIQNNDFLRTQGVIRRIQKWIEKILSSESQSVMETEIADEENTNVDEIEFAEWMVQQLGNYEDDYEIIKNYYSNSFVLYLFSRLLGEYENVPPVLLTDEGIGESIKNSLIVITSFIKNGNKCQKFWEGISALLQNTLDLENYDFISDILKDLIEYIPDESALDLLESILEGITNFIEEDLVENIKDWATSKLQLVIEIRRTINRSLNQKELEKISSLVSGLLNLKKDINPTILKFVENYSNEFISDDFSPIISELISSFNVLSIDKEHGQLVLETIIYLHKYLNGNQKEKIVNSINSLIISNDPNKVECAILYIKNLCEINGFHDYISKYCESWVDLIKNEPFPIFKPKITVCLETIQLGLLDANIFIKKIIPIIPFGGEQNKIALITTELIKIKDEIDSENGGQLSNTIMNHIGAWGGSIIGALDLASNWFSELEQSQDSAFISQMNNQLAFYPKRSLHILERCWEYFTASSIKQFLKQMFSIEEDDEYKSIRSRNTSIAISQIDVNKKVDFIMTLWEELIQSSKNADDFLEIAINSIDLYEVSRLRENAILEIRENGASELSKIKLKFLVKSTREDVREIMPIVNLFVNLFGRGNEDIRLALDYIIPVLKPLGIRTDHKRKLAEAMGQASSRSAEDINIEIHEKAKELGLKKPSYRKYWN